jgi:UDP-galactopyranose mutase
VLVVGAGFYGATIAERLATQAGLSVVVIDRRPHIGGNAYSNLDPETGIEVHNYGPHLFHTPNREVWEYLNGFSAFTDYKHRVFSSFQGRVYSMPINLGTICEFFGGHFSPAEARQMISSHAAEMAEVNPANLEEKAISLIGRPLYEAFIRGYTAKQWQIDPRRLPANIIQRLPVRFDFNSRYFNDAHEGLPVDGYTAIFERMLSHPRISTYLSVDYFDLKPYLSPNLKCIYTGPIDHYYDFCEGELGWRTIDFERSIAPVADFQGTAVINYADEDIPWTRIVEFRHLHPERIYSQDKTVIVKEFARFATRIDEPYYPIATESDKALYQRYRKRAGADFNVYFAGRLGTYRYLDMHQAIGAALKQYKTVSDWIISKVDAVSPEDGEDA